ncbi:hypothetical protein V1509DRAFT_636673 [Lipomyces kononenkoae]
MPYSGLAYPHAYATRYYFLIARNRSAPYYCHLYFTQLPFSHPIINTYTPVRNYQSQEYPNMAPRGRQVPTFRVSGLSHDLTAQPATASTPSQAADAVATSESARLVGVDLLEDTSDGSDSEPDLPTVAQITTAASIVHASVANTAANTAAARSAASPVPSVAATPAPRSRVYYTEEHKLHIMKLCDEYQHEYTSGNRTKFFEKVASIFNEEHDFNTPTVRALVVNLLKKRREELKDKSGAAEADTDLKQALDSFLGRFDDVNAEVSTSRSGERQRADALREEQESARRVRDQMLWGRGRSDAHAVQTDDSDAEESTSQSTSQERRKRVRRRSRRSEGPVTVDIGLGPASAHAASVFERSIDKLIAAPIVVQNERDLEERFDRLEHNVQDLKDSVRSVLDLLLHRDGN